MTFTVVTYIPCYVNTTSRKIVTHAFIVLQLCEIFLYIQAVLPMADTLDTCCTCLCDCVRHVNSERKRMRSLVMTVMERLEMEEKMNQETKRKGEKEMADLMMKLATLQKSLLSEQLRVKTLLNNKDIIIR